MPGSHGPDPPAPTTVLFIRHAETDWNLTKRFQGLTDIPLNDAGGAQAEQLAEALKPLQLASVWTSPLQRARHTGVAIAAAAGVTLHLDERLLERELGVMQGYTAAEVRVKYPKVWEAWKNQQQFPPEAGVEPDAAVIARVESALFELAAAYPGRTVAVVGHGAALRCVLHRPVGTASINVFSIGPGYSWRLVRADDASHLRGLRGGGMFKDADADQWGEDRSATTVMLCRHGETDWNLARKFQGMTDIPLNADGRQQAQIIAECLSTQKLHAIWSSPLMRAHSTGLTVAAATGVELQVDWRLRERNLGVMQGLNPTELQERYPSVIEAWKAQTPLPPEADAEPDADVIARVESALFDLAASHPGKNVAIILHGATIRCFLKRAVGNARITTPKNVSITTLVVGPGRSWRIVQVADVSHMPKPNAEELLVEEKLAEEKRLAKEAAAAGSAAGAAPGGGLAAKL